MNGRMCGSYAIKVPPTRRDHYVSSHKQLRLGIDEEEVLGRRVIRVLHLDVMHSFLQ